MRNRVHCKWQFAFGVRFWVDSICRFVFDVIIEVCVNRFDYCSIVILNRQVNRTPFLYDFRYKLFHSLLSTMLRAVPLIDP